jgi:crotonobetainyl-CoA:carnitine CoA-transferase CaiB-like acyl-CoA transferase
MFPGGVGEIAIAVGTDRQFSRLAAALGLPELTSIGGVPQIRSPVRLDGEPMPVEAPPPALGQRTASILAAMGEDRAP